MLRCTPLLLFPLLFLWVYWSGRVGCLVISLAERSKHSSVQSVSVLVGQTELLADSGCGVTTLVFGAQRIRKLVLAGLRVWFVGVFVG